MAKSKMVEPILCSISSKQNRLTLMISVREDIIPVNFFIKGRHKESVRKTINSTFRYTADRMNFFEIIITDELLSFIDDVIMDISMSYAPSREVLKEARIKSNHSTIEFNVINRSNDQIVQPYTTKKGNLSFRYLEQKLSGKFEEVKMDKNGKLFFRGYFMLPESFVDESTVKLSAIDKRTEITIPITISTVDKNKNIFEMNGQYDILEHLQDDEKDKSFKFYIEAEKKFGEETEKLVSARLKSSIPGNKFPYQTTLKFQHKRKKVICTVTAESKFLRINVKKPNRIKATIKQFKRKWYRFKRGKSLRTIYKSLFVLTGKMPAAKNVIIFESFAGKQYSDNPRAIYEFLKENDYDFKMYWSFDRNNMKKFESNENIKAIRRFSIKWLILMSRAKYWVINSRLPLWLPKPKHTIYLQTWHGTPLKKLGTDIEEVHMPGTTTEKYKRNFVTAASKWDILVSPNNYSTEIFKRAFDYKNAIIETGYPRNDYLTRNNNKEKIRYLKEKLNLPLNKKIMLYAPTWRDNNFYSKGKYKFDLQLDLERLREEFEDEYIILLRMHYLVAENLQISQYENFVYDLSKYDDIRDLYIISDLLITDYSSVFFDYSVLKRPIFFFVFDIEQYRDNLRGFYLDFKNSAPGPFSKTTYELIKDIKNNNEVNGKKFRNFYNEFCYLEDGNASERVVKHLFE
ncbi:CDP-glycerol glycerophosphotransferase family protein [Sediminibacillus sp. JSM 1682029]|uniref:CDP-glycerol glycerophosphotransferase family protein n=1 Tax=Sediminibacillus sp. JSM 1682029 TaxID=3229857 RepID=UPI0035263C77